MLALGTESTAFWDLCDDDDELVVYSVIGESLKQQRRSCLFRKRWDSEYLRELAINEKSFVSEYRLDPGGFDLLHDLLEGQLSVNEQMARVSGCAAGSGLISTQSRLGAALIMLAGGRALESMRTHGLAMSSVYKNFRTVIRAINEHPALEICCDSSLYGLETRAAGFKALGQRGLFSYCTGAIDGLAITIQAPPNDQVMNQTRFFSGSKKKFCLNMQGVCNANCEFIAVTCKHVGSTNDAIAFETSSLKALCAMMPLPFHWNGDNAYTCNETMMIPFAGINAIQSPEKESFNFWHSQLRITIERTFGIFIQRFGIFWHALQFDLDFIMEIVHACCRLHNFCIRRRLPIVNDKYAPTDLTAVNENGGLINTQWTSPLPHHEPALEQANLPRTGNTLRDMIVETIVANHYMHGRDR